jgi:predicted site-specific integrase-resolvase
LVYKPGAFFRAKYGVSAAALRGWASSGRLDYIRSPGGKRFYSVDGVAALLGDGRDGSTDKRAYIYARVSSAKQRADLDRQVADLKEAYPGHVLVKDIASGINFKRPGLCSLLERALGGLVSEVVVLHRDRLARFGFELLDFVFTKAGARVVVHGRDEGASDERDLADDLLAVTALFVASHHGRRAAENRKRRREEAGAGGEAQESRRGGSATGGDRSHR